MVFLDCQNYETNFDAMIFLPSPVCSQFPPNCPHGFQITFMLNALQLTNTSEGVLQKLNSNAVV